MLVGFVGPQLTEASVSVEERLVDAIARGVAILAGLPVTGNYASRQYAGSSVDGLVLQAIS